MPRTNRPVRRRLRARRWLALAAIGLIGLLYYKPIRSYLSTRADLEGRSAEVRKLRAQKTTLERRAARVESGDELLRQARRLGLVRPGERLFIVKGIDAWRRSQAASRRRR
jgi:cell division protein FtsB